VAQTVVLLCVAALLGLLATPIHVRVALERDDAVQARARVSWLFGLVRASVFPRTTPEGPRLSEERPVRRGKALGARLGRRLAAGMLRPDLRARSVAFLIDVLKALRPRDVHLRALIGMDDPADTGQLWAVLGPLGVLLASRDVHLEPSFEEACFRFQAAARVRLIPAQLLCLSMAFLVSPPFVRALVSR